MSQGTQIKIILCWSMCVTNILPTLPPLTTFEFYNKRFQTKIIKRYFFFLGCSNENEFKLDVQLLRVNAVG